MSGARQCARPVSSGSAHRADVQHRPAPDLTTEFCKLKDVGNRQWTVECEAINECKKGKDYSLGISSSSVANREMEWEEFGSVKTLSFYLKSLVDKSSRKQHGGFVIIKCLTVRDVESKQILVLPPRIKSQKTKERSININLVLASNLTRAGLYHGMEQTVSLMTQLNTLPSSRTEVLDFSLLQDLGGQRNLAALVSGSVSSVSSPSLLANSSSAGRHVSWQGPGCWNTSLDLTGLEPVTGLQPLNSTGVSLALCPQHVRLTSRGEVSILLASSQLLTASLSSAHQPHISLTSMPASGLGPDTDPMLASYLEALSGLPHTVTVLTSLSSSDPSQSLPLFVFIPHKVRSMMAESSWQNLIINQHSLVSMIDLHDTLMSLLTVTRDTEDRRSPHGLFSADLDTRQCAGLPRGQFDCVCQPQVTSMDREIMEAVADILASLHNSDLARSTDTVCARLGLEAVVNGEVSTHGPDDDFLQLQVVFVLVPSDEEDDEELRDSKTVITGAIELDLVTKTLQLNTWQYDKTQRVSRFGCIQQYSSQEDVRAGILRWLEIERVKSGVKVDSVFTENGMDCIWMVSKRFPGTNLASLVMAAACDNPVEVTVKTNLKDGDSLVWTKGERKLTLVSGEIALVNVIMSPIQSSRAPDWDYSLVAVRYLDPEEED